MEDETFVVVGAGIFGASTALHLSRSHPGATIKLIDRVKHLNPSAAASDLNKIVRADYEDVFYMKLGLEAQELWRNDPIYSPYYHESGMLLAENIGMGSQSLANFKKLGADHAAELLTPQEARARFPVLSAANWTDVTECYYNGRSGWAEADGAVRSALTAAEKNGVQMVEGDVKSLIFNASKECEGVELTDGSRVFGNRTILCTGAYTAKLLADSAPEWPELQVDGRMVAAAAVQCQARYDPAEEERLSTAPVHLIGMWHTHGEAIPAFDGRLKFNCEISFTNMEYHEGLKKEISVPPSRKSQCTFSDDVPQGLKEEVQNVVKNVYGDTIKGLEIESYRMCWDAITPTQDWVISTHPHCKNLTIAAGGSFHSWKFLPVLGAYVVKQLEGKLDAESSEKWAWDRKDSGGAACVFYIPTRDVKDIGPFKGWPKSAK